jgi:hypothetical protein
MISGVARCRNPSSPYSITALQYAILAKPLANVLRSCGGTARLEEAVTAFRAALEELTRERAPHQSAITRDNLAAVEELLAARRHRAG